MVEPMETTFTIGTTEKKMSMTLADIITAGKKVGKRGISRRQGLKQRLVNLKKKRSETMKQVSANSTLKRRPQIDRMRGIESTTPAPRERVKRAPMFVKTSPYKNREWLNQQRQRKLHQIKKKQWFGVTPVRRNTQNGSNTQQLRIQVSNNRGNRFGIKTRVNPRAENNFNSNLSRFRNQTRQNQVINGLRGIQKNTFHPRTNSSSFLLRTATNPRNVSSINQRFSRQVTVNRRGRGNFQNNRSTFGGRGGFLSRGRGRRNFF